nr:hypothetical protein [Phenylobacterium sp. J367]
MRLLSADDEIETGYTPAELDLWAGRFREYASGAVPADFRPPRPDGPARDAPGRLRLRDPRRKGARPARGDGAPGPVRRPACPHFIE